LKGFIFCVLKVVARLISCDWRDVNYADL